MDKKLPQRPRSHQIDDRAVASFLNKKPPQWVHNRSENDYGWDYLITIESLPGRLGNDFFLQLKGSESVSYLANGCDLSHPLEVTTINWLLAKPIPAMLAVCDVAKSDKPIYWTWLDNAVEEVRKINPSWVKQKIVTLRIPVSNSFSDPAFSEIELHVKKWHEEQSFGREVIQALTSNSPVPGKLEGARSETAFQLKQDVFTSLQKAGLVDLSETEAGLQAEILAVEDLETKEKLKQASAFLNAYHDSSARQILQNLAEVINSAAIGIKASYTNCQGVLALHENDDRAALEAFQKALELRPQETKYAINVLTVEYKIALETTGKLPLDWDARLESIIAINPSAAGAVRLKAARLASLNSLAAAEQYLHSSKLWNEDRQDSLITLAEISRDCGELEHALELLSEAESLQGAESNPLLFSLKGSLLLHKATCTKDNEDRSIIRGFGPADLNIGQLRLSADAYLLACKLFGQRGYPIMAEQPFLNAATVLVLLGNPVEAARVARSFVEFHPDSGQGQGALAMALQHKGDALHAIPHAHLALDADPEFSQNYLNLIVILAHAEAYDELLEAASRRQREGFRTADEETLTRVMTAVAYAERGEFERASFQVEILLSKDDFYSDGVAAEAAVAKRRGDDVKSIAARVRERLNKIPNDPRILTVLVHYLLPPDQETADEIINVVRRLAEMRQLSPEEICGLGRAYLLKGRLDNAETIFRSGRLRYPNDARFLVDLAHVLSRKGEDETAYDVMAEYVDMADRDPTKYWNFGMLARVTGRLDEAIMMLQKAIQREKDPAATRKLHAILFDAKRRRGDPAKEIFRHVIAFGELTNGDPEDEARFLIMGLVTPLKEADLEEPELKSYRDKFASRLEAYCQNHPQSSLIRRFTLPEGLPDDQQGLHILSQIVALQLPQQLVASQVELSARGTPWPLSFRKEYLGSGRSIFEYWEYCAASKDFAHSIHVWYAKMDFAEEMQSINLRRPVCIDITALLTLLSLDLLDPLFEIFPEIILARGTIQAVREEFVKFGSPHPYAVAIDNFIKGNRKRVRVRPAYGGLEEELTREERYQKTGNLWISRTRTFADMIHDGIGETVMVAKEAKVPLYCDDIYIRFCAKNEYNLQTFSTLALLSQLRTIDRLAINDEAECLVKLINHNYRHVRFSALHLHDRLRSIVHASKQNDQIDIKCFNSDRILGPFLRQFGDREITDSSLLGVACEWWFALLKDDTIPVEVIQSIIETVTFKISQRRLENVLEGVSRETPSRRIAIIWVYFLVRLYSTGQRDRIQKAWSIIKSCAEKMFGQDEKTVEHLLWDLVPDALYQLIMRSREVDDTKKIIALIQIPQEFSPGDANRFESRISRHLLKRRQAN